MALTAKKDYPDGYPEDALRVLNAMSLTHGTDVNLVGSMALRSQIYAGDYDAYEVVHVSSNKDAVHRLKQAVRRLMDLPETYIGDVKSGAIEEWKVMKDTWDATQSRETLKKLFDDGIIDHETYTEGLRKFRGRPSKLEVLKLRDQFRPHIIRWKPYEVLKGHKKLKDGRTYTLEEAVVSPTITKIDVVAWVQNSRFTDFSMIYEFVHHGKTLNPGLRDIETAIRENIFMLYNEHNYYKMAKRMFVLAKYKGHTEVLEKLTPMFNGDLGRLYIVYGDLGTLEYILENVDTVPYSKIEFELDQFKARLSNVSLDRYISSEDDILKTISEMVEMRKSSYSKESLLNLVVELKTKLYTIMTDQAKKYLKRIRLMPSY